MEYKQMRTYPFFKYLGAFSTMPHNRSHNLSSLRYAVQSMQRPNASLFIYPEGKIVRSDAAINFKRGIGWLKKQLPGVDFVPIGIHMHTIRHDKPELHLWVGEPAPPFSTNDISQITSSFEDILEQVLEKVKSTGGFDHREYSKFW